MWKSVTKSASSIAKFLNNETLQTQQIRTVFVFKRRNEVPLHKKEGAPRKLKSRHYIYDLVKDTSIEKQKSIDIILTSFVDGWGNAGDKVSVPKNFAYTHLLLPRLGVYATPENVEKYKDVAQKVDIIKYSSRSAKKVCDLLERLTLSVILSKENPWVLKPWHVRVAFRKIGIILPAEALEIPSKEIKGPDMNIENKEFYVTVTINNSEKVNVRCRIHHWSRDVADRLAHTPEFWKKPTECIYPEFAPILAQLPSQVVEQSEKEEEFLN